MSVFRLSRLELALPLSDLSGAALPAAARPGAAPARPRGAAATAGRASAPPCPPTATQADAWVDGELSAGAAAALDAHLRACPPCRAHVEALARLVAAVRRQEAQRPSAPASLRARARELAAMWHDEEARAADELAARRPAR